MIILIGVYPDGVCEQVIYTVGRDPQYQNTIVADTQPLVTSPVIVCLIYP